MDGVCCDGWLRGFGVLVSGWVLLAVTVVGCLGAVTLGLELGLGGFIWFVT